VIIVGIFILLKNKKIYKKLKQDYVFLFLDQMTFIRSLSDPFILQILIFLGAWKLQIDFKSVFVFEIK